MGRAIGIDLGTTYSVMAVRNGPSITIIKNALGEELTRSVVASCDSSKQIIDLVASSPKAAKSLVKYDNRQFLVGRIAAEIALESSGDERSRNTIFSIKRLIGRSYNDVDPYENRPIVPEMKKRWPYEIKSIANGTDIRVMLGGKEYSPIDISAIILKKLKEDAEAVFGEEVTHAVITVPAYFSARQ